MAKTKAKWLTESTNKELLEILKEILTESPEDKELIKAQKIVAELTERLPEEDQELTVVEAIAALQDSVLSGIETIKAAYSSEIEALGDSDDEDDDEDDEEDEDEEEEEEEVKPKKSKKAKAEAPEKSKKSKKSKKVEEPEEEDEDEDDEDEEEDYTTLSLKALKTECRNRGIKVNKSMQKSDLIKLLEADDKA